MISVRITPVWFDKVRPVTLTNGGSFVRAFGIVGGMWRRDVDGSPTGSAEFVLTDDMEWIKVHPYEKVMLDWSAE